MRPIDRLRALGQQHVALFKAKAHEVGHRSKRKDGWYVKQLDGSWDKERAAPPPADPAARVVQERAVRHALDQLRESLANPSKNPDLDRAEIELYRRKLAGMGVNVDERGQIVAEKQKRGGRLPLAEQQIRHHDAEALRLRAEMDDAPNRDMRYKLQHALNVHDRTAQYWEKVRGVSSPEERKLAVRDGKSYSRHADAMAKWARAGGEGPEPAQERPKPRRAREQRPPHVDEMQGLAAGMRRRAEMYRQGQHESRAPELAERVAQRAEAVASLMDQAAARPKVSDRARKAIEAGRQDVEEMHGLLSTHIASDRSAVFSSGNLRRAWQRAADTSVKALRADRRTPAMVARAKAAYAQATALEKQERKAEEARLAEEREQAKR